MRSHSSLSKKVEADGVVEVEAKRVDASGSDSTRVLSNKLDVEIFSKNVFQYLDSNVSCHVVI